MLEDDPKLASLVRKGLEAHGFTVDFCAHGDEAFTLATTRSYDALVLDIMVRSEEHTSELQSHHDLVCRLLLEKKKKQ